MLRNPKAGLVLALVMATSLWFYVQRILIPYQIADAAAHGRPRGILSDLYPRWLGTRELLLDHLDPYSAEVTRKIQTGHYGRPIDPKRPEDPKDEQRFAYPVYVVFLLAPVARLPFPGVRAGASWTLVALTLASMWIWLHVMNWRSSRGGRAIFFVLTIGSFAATQGIKLQQLSLLVAFLIAAGIALLSAEQLFFSGVLFAIATIKPQLAVLPVAWLMLWSLSRWRKRQWWLWGFLAAMALLVGGGELLLPGWISEFRLGLGAYARYTGGGSLLDVLAGAKAGAALAIAAILATAVLAWRRRNVEAQSADFQIMLAWVLAVTVVVVPMTAPYNQLLLLPAVILIVQAWNELWRKSRLGRLLCALALLALAWPWVSSIALAIASAVLPAVSVQKAWAVPLWTSLAIPPMILAVVILLIGRPRNAIAVAGVEA